MTYEARLNGSKVLKCDLGSCDSELLGHEDPDLFSNANLAGWVEHDGRHYCLDCQRGTGMARMALAAIYGTDRPTIQAPIDVTAGDPVVAPDGRVVGRYAHDAPAGQSVRVEPYAPGAKAPDISDKYAEILGLKEPTAKDQSTQGQDDPWSVCDEEDEPTPKKRVRPPVSVSKTVPKEWRKRNPTQGTDGGSDLVAAPARPMPKVKIEKLDESAFDFLDIDMSKTRWDPDA